MCIVLPRVTPSCHRIREDEKARRCAPLLIQPLLQQEELASQHRLQALSADIAIARSVDRIADRHVVSGHGLGYRAGSTSNAKEPPRDFLAGPDLDTSPVLARIEVYA